MARQIQDCREIAGVSTRGMYDESRYSRKTRASREPIQFKIDPQYAVHPESCAKHETRRAGHRIDLESVLKGIIDAKYAQRRDIALPKSCCNARYSSEPELESEYSRYTHPACDSRQYQYGRNFRFDYPLRDPQCAISDRMGINTRLQAKDDHRTVWQQPLDQSQFLPVAKPVTRRQCRIKIDCETN